MEIIVSRLEPSVHAERVTWPNAYLFVRPQLLQVASGGNAGSSSAEFYFNRASVDLDEVAAAVRLAVIVGVPNSVASNPWGRTCWVGGFPGVLQ